MTDPLLETLFRSTTVAPAIGSAAPVRVVGTRTRAGNSMGRTRAALLEGARQAVMASGTRITMSQVAAAAGVAKATLYNHFRTREALLEALLLDSVTTLIDVCAGLPLPDALALAAQTLAQHPVLRALAAAEPGTLADLGRIDDRHEAWRLAQAAVAAAVAADERGGAELVVRWLASYVLTPANAESIAADVAILIVALPDVAQVGAEAEIAVTAVGA